MTAVERAYDFSDALDAQTVVLGGAAPPSRCDRSPSAVGDYHLTRRIGSGGYGEVWQATAPGGLPKAIKILHGRFDGRQAEMELRSLEKMRAVRHPFLLSIERIEIVDSRLIIVTELAENSLEDRFQELRAQGQAGVPREELLGYLRDAADALDFLCEQHGLQHLDVKPANLLRQGNRIKVADFGVVKELDGIAESPISGFTPLYAPPELIQGKPCRNSDQYALAIVYQMLLTGEPPFAGRNAAQIVAQHLNSRPDLSSLPNADRPAIARALSKTPRARFDSCRQFIDALSARTEAAKRTSTPSAVPSAGESLRAAPGLHLSSGTWSAQRREPDTSAPSVPLKPLSPLACAIGWRPTLFVGIGGMAGQVLLALRKKFCEHFGADVELPAFPLLYIDSDPGAISAAVNPAAEIRLRTSETLAIPLKRPADYRESSAALLDWLNRRWLYNIPRSGLVEGIRPLGRLAFVDHLPSIRRMIRERLEYGTREVSLDRTRGETQQLHASTDADIYVIASISGGTGSGCVLDFGWIVRQILQEMNLRSHSLNGVLLQNSIGPARRGGITAANAVSCLQELQQYCRSGSGYPGDPACGLPMTEEPPFEHLYLAGLGDNDEVPDWRRDVTRVAEYLFRGAATSAGWFFDAHRRNTKTGVESPEKTISLRTVAVVNSMNAGNEATAQVCDSLCGALVHKWLVEVAAIGRTRSDAATGLSNWTRSLLHRLQLDSGQLAGRIDLKLRVDAGRELEAFARSAYQAASHLATEEAALGAMLNGVDREFAAANKPDRQDHRLGKIIAGFRDELHSLLEEASTTLRREVIGLVDAPVRRMSSASGAIPAIVSQIEQTIAAMTSAVEGLKRDADVVRSRCVSSANPDARHNKPLEAECRTACYRYCVLRLCAIFYECVIAHLRNLREGVLALSGRLSLIRRQLHELEKEFTRPANDAETRDSDVGTALTEFEGLATAMDDRLRNETNRPLIGLLAGDAGMRELRDLLRARAADFLKRRAAEREISAGSSACDPSLAANIQTGVSAGVPTGLSPAVSGLGAAHRVLAVHPDSLDSAGLRRELTNRFGNCVTLSADADDELFVCCEVAGINIDRAIDKLTDGDPTTIETANRLHTRSDVKWQ